MTSTNETSGSAGPWGLFDHTPETLSRWCAACNVPKYRAAQILQWVFTRGVGSFEKMTNLPLTLRKQLAAEAVIYESHVQASMRADDGTTKLLLIWPDGASSECVLISEGDRRTACVSTQVGCAVGCVFCASGLHGLRRNLSAGQIVEQAMRLQQLCQEDRKLTNVVFMGIGEPLANYQATTAAVRTINADWGMGIGGRKITISTIGLPRQIRRLADERLQVTLAISLHAPTDALRRRLVPWAERVPLADLIEAANYYFERTGREVTIEYVLLKGVNDRVTHAHQLAEVARKMRCNVNLIRYNPVAGLGYERPSAEAARAFFNRLRQRGVNAHVRKSRGSKIDAACGQLRRRGVAMDTVMNKESSR